MPKVYSVKKYSEMANCSIDDVFKTIQSLEYKGIILYNNFEFVKIGNKYFIKPTRKFLAEFMLLIFKNIILKYYK
jgi:hypothetical protein